MRLHAEQIRVDQDAITLDFLQHDRSRQFDFFINEAQLCIAFDLRPHRLMQLQRDVGVFRGIRRGALELDFIETDLGGALAADILETDRLAVQVAQ